MISFRRLIASILAGGLLVLVSAAQASAQAQPAIDRALHGVELGLAAATELVGDGDRVVIDEELQDAFAAYDAWVQRHLGDDSKRQGLGEGPINAAKVHQALRQGDLPSQIDKVDGSKLGELTAVYERLKGKSDEAKAKKDKADRGKSEAAKNKAPGQQNNRP